MIVIVKSVWLHLLLLPKSKERIDNGIRNSTGIYTYIHTNIIIYVHYSLAAGIQFQIISSFFSFIRLTLKKELHFFFAIFFLSTFSYKWDMIKCFYKNIDNIKKILRYVGIIVFFGNNIYIEKFPKKCYDDIKNGWG